MGVPGEDGQNVERLGTSEERPAAKRGIVPVRRYEQERPCDNRVLHSARVYSLLDRLSSGGVFAEFLVPEVTVVIPTSNRCSLLRLALRGALAQEKVDLEVIVVDDGSQDRTSALLAELNDPRVHVVRHEVRLGLPQARNAGIEQARGNWIAFLDDDDVWSPRKLRAQLDVAARTGASFVYAAAVLLDENRRMLDEALPTPDPDGLKRSLLAHNVMPAGGSNVIARTHLVRSLNGFDENLPQLADWDLWIRLSDRAHAAACREVLVGYLRHSASMLLTERRDVLWELEYLVHKHRELSVEEGIEFDRLRLSRWVAWGHRRAGRRFRAAASYLRGAYRYRNAGNLARAGGALIGEWAIQRPAASRVSEPVWLKLYR